VATKGTFYNTKRPSNQNEETNLGLLGEQESPNIEELESMALEERGSTEVIMELEPPLQQRSPSMSNDTEANTENPHHVEHNVRRSEEECTGHR